MIFLYLFTIWSAISMLHDVSPFFDKLVKRTVKNSAIRLYMNVPWINFFKYFFIFFGFLSMIFLFVIILISIYPIMKNKKLKNKFLLHIILYYFSYSTSASALISLCCILTNDQISLFATLIAITALFGFLFNKSFPFKLISFIDSSFEDFNKIIKKIDTVSDKLFFGSDKFGDASDKNKNKKNKFNHFNNHHS